MENGYSHHEEIELREQVDAMFDRLDKFYFEIMTRVLQRVRDEHKSNT